MSIAPPKDTQEIWGVGLGDRFGGQRGAAEGASEVHR